jgi:hypothetical protein
VLTIRLQVHQHHRLDCLLVALGHSPDQAIVGTIASHLSVSLGRVVVKPQEVLGVVGGDPVRVKEEGLFTSRCTAACKTANSISGVARQVCYKYNYARSCHSTLERARVTIPLHWCPYCLVMCLRKPLDCQQCRHSANKPPPLCSLNTMHNAAGGCCACKPAQQCRHPASRLLSL